MVGAPVTPKEGPPKKWGETGPNSPKTVQTGPERPLTVSRGPLPGSNTLCGQLDVHGAPLGPRRTPLHTSYCLFSPILG